MAKSIFRYLRGELNGYYITNLYDTLNSITEETRNFLGEFNAMQFNTDMGSDYIYGLGKFAGIFLPRLARSDTKSAMRMTESFTVNGTEYSERGLLDTETEEFKFYHTDETSTEDINTLATTTEKSSMPGDSDTVEGYTSSADTDILDENGNVKASAIHTTAPIGVAYSEYYGNKFLFLSEANITYQQLEESLFFELVKALQWVRYNGESVKSLGKIISIVCPNGLVKINHLEVLPAGKRVLVYYDYDDSVSVDLKQQRLVLLEYIVNMKFTQVELVENI